MLRRTAVTLVLVLLGTRLEGAAVLKGIIVGNELGGPPLPRVQVGVVAGANTTASDAAGKFIFRFPGKHPGDMVQLTVRKPGYVVVNDIQLRLPLPKDADAQPLTILLCREGDREEMARRFYRLKSAEALDQTYRQRFGQLKRDFDAARARLNKKEETYSKRLTELERRYAADLARLRQQRDQARAMVQQLANELARSDTGMATEPYRTAMCLFLVGRGDQALRLLDEERIHLSLNAARRRKVEAAIQFEMAVHAFLLKAQLLTMRLRFDEAGETLEAACKVAPDSVCANFEYAKFCQQLNRNMEAIAAYERCLELAIRERREQTVAATLDNLSTLYLEQNRITKALEFNQMARTLFRELAEGNPRAYLSDLAMASGNLGRLLVEQGRMDEAEKAFQEALRISHDLAKWDPQQGLRKIASTKSDLGTLYRLQKRMDDAQKAVQEAVRIRRQLAAQDSAEHLQALASSLLNLGIVRCEQHQMDKARKALDEALSIYNRLAQQNPERYLPRVATTLNSLGIMHDTQDRIDEASTAFGHALRIHRQLAQRNPQAHLPDVAGSLNNLGALYLGHDRLDDARKPLEDALKIRRQFAEKRPEVFLPDVAASLNNLCVLACQQKRIDDARKAGREALEIFETLAKREPKRYQKDVERVKGLLEAIDRRASSGKRRGVLPFLGRLLRSLF